ncbi:dienelactone hydrolase family protein [Herbaspirillum autotrophicum]|uniref:dienelactone hydrolase family protein n=1 Tax=Herbaspirillum autotrophicum TaxID=180195 RepID=UPI001E3CBFE3|nr:dienelactone hydrolase family protein [Herbaspirillum autotrophicum]
MSNIKCWSLVTSLPFFVSKIATYIYVRGNNDGRLAQGEVMAFRGNTLPIALRALALSGLLSCVTIVQAAPSPPPMRSERVTLTSISDSGGKATALFGFWIKSTARGPEKKPTVIALHGCGGLYSVIRDNRSEFTPRHIAMARALTDAGYNVLFPDSFTPRGKRAICQASMEQRNISSSNRRHDVQAALRWLATQPEVDPSRVALLGWSHGASTLLSALNLAQTDVAVRKIQPKAAIAFYPNCVTYAKKTSPYKPAAPLLILMGENDDWTPPEACEALEKRLEGSDTPITLRLYPDTYHDFDAPGTPVHVRFDISGAGRDGVTSGANPTARADAYKEMLKFLKDKFD